MFRRQYTEDRSFLCEREPVLRIFLTVKRYCYVSLNHLLQIPPQQPVGNPPSPREKS